MIPDVPEVPDSLPQPICQLKADVLSLEQEVKEEVRGIKKKYNDILQKIAEVRWRIAEISTSTLMAAAAGAALNIAASIAMGLANVAKSAIAAIIGVILRLLMDSSDTLYALAGFPHEKAFKSTISESAELAIMSSRVRIVRGILTRWSDKFEEPEYARVMASAIPVVESALESLEIVYDGLDRNNAYFDNASYDKAMSNIKTAIDLLSPDNTVDNFMNLSEGIEAEADLIFEKNSAKIRKYWNKKRDEEAAEYQKSLIGINSNASSKRQELQEEFNKRRDSERNKAQEEANRRGDYFDVAAFNASFQKSDKENDEYDKIADSVNVEGNRELEKYSAKLKVLEIREEAELAVEKPKVYGDAVLNNFKKSAKSIKDEFLSDSEILLKSLKEIGKASLKAGKFSNTSQTMCTAMVFFEPRMEVLIKKLIELIAGAGNIAAKPVKAVVGKAADQTSVTLDILEEALEDLGSTKKKVPIKGAADMIKAKTMLTITDSMLSASISKRLTELINADEGELGKNRSYQQFVSDLDNIQDWDGGVGTWARGRSSAVRSPYVSIVSETGKAALELLTPENPYSNNIKRATGGILDAIGVAQAHNSQVISVLSSWSPPQSKAAEELKNLLNKLGLLEMFAMAMDILNLLSSLGAIFSVNIDYKKCEEKYPEMFETPVLVRALSEEKRNLDNITAGDANELNSTLAKVNEMNGEIKHDKDKLLSSIGDDDLVKGEMV